jgi:hypothetical protein
MTINNWPKIKCPVCESEVDDIPDYPLQCTSCGLDEAEMGYEPEASPVEIPLD